MSHEADWGYFLWLVERTNADIHGPQGYSYLLSYLFDTEFYAVIEADVNRARDGVNLRREYAEATGSPIPDMDVCRVLELLVALSARCDKDIMYMPKYGDRTSEWFWMMIRNLGLMQYDNHHFDERSVSRVISRFMDRNYNQYGSGGLFPLKNLAEVKKDQREVGIWDQMQAYMIEKYGF